MAGKRKRNERRRTKMAARKQRKRARAARYAALAGSPENKKKRRRLARSGRLNPYLHGPSNCGNVGCRKCYPAVALRSDMHLRPWKYPQEG